MRLGSLVFLLSNLIFINGQTAMTQPPKAKTQKHEEIRHGQTVSDPWFWLREKSNSKVIDYLNEENQYTDLMTQDISGFTQDLYNEMLGRIKQTDMQVPYARGSWLYYSRTEEGKQYSLMCRKPKSGGKEDVFLDLNELAKGYAFASLGGMTITEDGHLLAFTMDTTGFRQYRLSIKDLSSGKLIGFTAERVTSMTWSTDGETLFYTTEDSVTKRSNQVWRRSLKDPEPHLVMEEKDEKFSLYLNKSSDENFIFVSIRSTDTWENWSLDPKNPNLSPICILPRKTGHKYDVDHGNNAFFIRTNANAKNFKIVRTLSPSKVESWVDFVAHNPNILIEGFDLFKGYAVLSTTQNALAKLQLYDFERKKWDDFKFDESLYTLSGAENPEYDTPSYRFSYQSMITPPTLYEYDFKSQTKKVLKQQEIIGDFNPKDYVTERQWAVARDGVRIPLSILHKKGIQRDGKSPAFLYAYGSYGLGLDPSFSSARLSLVNRGIVFVLAHIRGGNEMGEAWHDQGMLLNKMNTFNDFIDSALWLSKEKFVDPKRIVIEGGSAGGLLMGAVTNMRPDLWAAVHSAVPFVDVMNTMWDESLPLTVGEFTEWGDPKDKTYYDYMLSYSPYDNISKQNYPPVLVTTSLNDSQVMYWEPAKYVAKLRTYKTNETPLLLKCNMAAGHGGSSGRYDALKERAFQWSWLLAQIGIKK